MSFSLGAPQYITFTSVADTQLIQLQNSTPFTIVIKFLINKKNAITIEQPQDIINPYSVKYSKAQLTEYSEGLKIQVQYCKMTMEMVKMKPNDIKINNVDAKDIREETIHVKIQNYYPKPNPNPSTQGLQNNSKSVSSQQVASFNTTSYDLIIKKLIDEAQESKIKISKLEKELKERQNQVKLLSNEKVNLVQKLMNAKQIGSPASNGKSDSINLKNGKNTLNKRQSQIANSLYQLIITTMTDTEAQRLEGSRKPDQRIQQLSLQLSKMKNLCQQLIGNGVLTPENPYVKMN